MADFDNGRSSRDSSDAVSRMARRYRRRTKKRYGINNIQPAPDAPNIYVKKQRSFAKLLAAQAIPALSLTITAIAMIWFVMTGKIRL